MKDNYSSCPPFEWMSFGNGNVIGSVEGKEVYHVISSGVRGNLVLVVETDRKKLPRSYSTNFFTMSVHEAADKGYLRFIEKAGKRVAG